MKSLVLLSVVVFVCSVLYWLVSRPKKKQLSQGVFISDLGTLPDGLYSVLIKESSPRMAAYSLSKPIGTHDEIYFIHHNDLPCEKGGKDFKDNFLVEEGKITA